MKNIHIISFHASHNFGSMLQSFALKKYLNDNFMNLGFETDIINFRSQTQKNMFLKPFGKLSLKNTIKSVLLIRYCTGLTEKYNKFESFIVDYLTRNEEISSVEELMKYYKDSDDYFVAGSDQIWNPSIKDFSIAYLLGFTNSKNKYSYAVSCGQNDISRYISSNCDMRNYISKFRAISVREEGTKEQISEYYLPTININVDPTLLIEKKEWYDLFGLTKTENRKYIYFYSLDYSSEMIETVQNVSAVLNLPVIVSNITNWKKQNMPFEKMISDGPIDFLKRIANAELVISSSYHGTLFSILFNKPFFVFNGKTDRRIKHIIQQCGLNNRNIDKMTSSDDIKNYSNIDFSEANNYFEKSRKETLDYFSNMLYRGEKDE